MGVAHCQESRDPVESHRRIRIRRLAKVPESVELRKCGDVGCTLCNRIVSVCVSDDASAPGQTPLSGTPYAASDWLARPGAGLCVSERTRRPALLRTSTTHVELALG